MNRPDHPEQTDDRLTRLALGESSGATPITAADRAEAAALRACADELKAALAKEPRPFVNSAAIAARALGEEPPRASRRRGSGFSVSVGAARADTGLSRWSFVAAAAAACVALALFTRTGSGDAGKSALAEVRRPDVGEGVVMMTPARGRSLAALAAGMPVSAHAGAAFRPAGRASLALAAPGARAYADLLRRELRAGRPVASSLWRTDALVNAFVAGNAVSVPGMRPVQVETALTEAPWDASLRVLRVTVRGYGREGEAVASRVVASADFHPVGVAGWRVLGPESGTPERPPASLRGGDAVTTLFEVRPAPGVSADTALASVSLRYVAAGRRDAETFSIPVTGGDCTTFAAADADTRFAAGLVAYVRTRDAADARALLALAGANADRRDFAEAILR